MAENGAPNDEDVPAADGSGLDPRFDPRFQRGYQDASAPAEPTSAPVTPRPEERRGLDPRFDPRFQRGYDPERHEQLRRPISADEVDDRPAFASTVKATISRPIEPPVARPAARTPVQPAASLRVGAASAPSAEPADVAEQPPLRLPAPAASVGGRNPYLIALWIACVALVAVGVALIVQSATTTSGGGFGISAFGDAFGVSAWAIAPPAVMVGLIGLVALTLSRALGWLAAHPDDADASLGEEEPT